MGICMGTTLSSTLGVRRGARALYGLVGELQVGMFWGAVP